MLPLISETFERTFCRALFIALCVVPTVGLAGWTYYQRLPGHRQVCERSLARQLGLSVKLGEVEHTRPGGIRLTAVELREPETNRVVARAARVDAARHGDDWWLTLVQPELELEGCRQLGEFVERHLRLPFETVNGKVYLWAADANLVDGERNWPIRQASGILVPSRQQMQARIVFRWNSAAVQQPVTISLVRDRRCAPAASRLDLDSGDAPFPLATLAPWIDCPGWLGDESTLLGHAMLEFDRTVNQWTIQGLLADVQLRQLVTAHFQQALDARGQVQLEAQGSGDRVQWATGSLHATSGGTIGRTLIGALDKRLGLSAAKLSNTVGESVPFDELALAFDLRNDGSLDLFGRARYAERAILVDRNGVLLSEPPTTQDTADLIRALAPATDPNLPAGPQTERLVRLLPIRGEPNGAKKNEPRASDNSPPRARS